MAMFSQGGITISKRRSRLKGDIMEALPCLTCAMRLELLFRERTPSSISEAEELSDQELEGAGASEDLGGIESDVEELSWDGLLINDDNDDEVTMYWSE